MKKLILPLFLGFLIFSVRAQQSVSIGTTETKTNAVLYLKGTGTQGLIIPVTTNHLNVPPTEGMIVYNSTDGKVYKCNGSAWSAIEGSSGGSDSQTLTVNGNAIAISGGNSVNIANSAPTQVGQLLMWNGTNWVPTSTTVPTITGQVLKWNASTKTWEAGTDIGSSPALNSTQILVGNASNLATAVNMSGDATISNTGVVTVGNNAITTAKISPSSTNGQILTTTAGSVQWATPASTGTPALNSTQILVGNASNIATPVNMSGDATISNTGAVSIANNAVNASKIAAGAVGLTQLANGPANNVLTTNGSGMPTWVVGGSGVTGVTANAPLTTSGTALTPVINFPSWPANAAGMLSNNGAGTLSWQTPASSFGSQSANFVFAAPNAAAGNPTFRALSTTDISSGTFSVARGGTGITSVVPGGVAYGGATNFAFSAAGTTGQVLQSNGSGTPTWVNAPAPSGAAGGDLSGTYPNPTIGSTAATGDNIITAINATSGSSINGFRVIPTFGPQNISTSGSANITTTLTVGGTSSLTGTTTLGSLSGAGSRMVIANATGVLSTQTIPGAGFSTLNVIPKGDGTSLVNSKIFDNGTNVGIGTTGPTQLLDVSGGSINTSKDYMIGGAAVLKAGSTNVLVGELTPAVTIGTHNSIVGTQAGQAMTGSATDNTYNGFQAGSGTTTGSSNTFIGSVVGPNTTTGSFNTFIGVSTGLNHINGNNNILIGNGADVASNSVGAIAIGRNAVASANNSMALGGTGADAVNVGINTNSPTQRLDVVGNVKFSGALMPNNLPGAAGQVLTSGGAGVPPTWTAPSGGGFSTLNTIPKGDGTGLTASSIFDNGSQVGIGTTSPGNKLDIQSSSDVLLNMSSSQASQGTAAGLRLSMFAGSTGTVYKIEAEKSDATSNSGQSDLVFKKEFSTAGGYLEFLKFDNSNGNVVINGNKTTTSAFGNLLVTNGRLGLGTNAPEQALDINGYLRIGAGATSSNEGILLATPAAGTSLIQAGGRATTNFIINQNNNAPMSFQTSGTERMRIDGSGKVGIGTVTPNAPLQLANTAANRKVVLSEKNNNDNEFYGLGYNANSMRYQVAGPADNHIFYAGFSSAASAEIMRVGIGYASLNGRNTPISPTSVFDIETDLGSGLAGMYVNTADPDGYPYYGYSTAGNSKAYTYLNGTTGTWNLSNNAVDRLSVTNTGKVGIGTITPATDLHIKHSNVGLGTTSGFRIESNTQNWTFATDASLGDLLLYDNGIARGQFLDGSGSYSAISDVRRKKDIKALESILPKINATQIRRYHFKEQDDNDPLHIGVIAQELKEVFPELVHYSEKIDLFTVDYAGMAPLAIKAIQEQQVLIDSLKIRVLELENSVRSKELENRQLSGKVTALSEDVELIKRAIGLDKEARK